MRQETALWLMLVGLVGVAVGMEVWKARYNRRTLEEHDGRLAVVFSAVKAVVEPEIPSSEPRPETSETSPSTDS